MVTPGIAVGYWKQRNSPRRARASAVSGSRSSPPKVADPPVTDVLGMTHERVREGALARAVRAHQRMDLSLRDLEVDALEDLLTLDGGMQAR